MIQPPNDAITTTHHNCQSQVLRNLHLGYIDEHKRRIHIHGCQSASLFQYEINKWKRLTVSRGNGDMIYV